MLFDIQPNIIEGKLNKINLPPKINYQLGRIVVGLGAAALVKLDIERLSPIPAGPKIFAANHPTTTDPGFLTLLSKEPMAIMIAETLYKVPILGKYLQNAGHITVIPGEGRQALENAIDELRAGHNVGIFTEGSLSPEQGGFMPPRTGTARLSLLTGLPIVPIGIHLDNAHVRYLNTKIEGKEVISRWCLSGPYAMTVGEPIYLTGDVRDRQLVRSLSKRIMERIISLSWHSEMRVAQMDYSVGYLSWLQSRWSHSFFA